MKLSNLPAAAGELIAGCQVWEQFGMVLSPRQAVMLAQHQASALPDTGRIDFGGGGLKKLADAAEKLTDGNYTSDSIAKLNDAISKAKDALENGDEAAIAGAYEELIDAITNLEMKGNKAALKAMLEKAAAILADTDAYVASTIDGLATVKADAQNVYDNADAVQSEINAAVKSLTLKIAAARLLGDVNGDGAVTTSDSVSVLAASAELTSLDADATASADVNGDGVADTLDAALILQTAAEK